MPPYCNQSIAHVLPLAGISEAPENICSPVIAVFIRHTLHSGTKNCAKPPVGKQIVQKVAGQRFQTCGFRRQKLLAGQFELLLRNSISEALSRSFGSHPYYMIAAFHRFRLWRTTTAKIIRPNWTIDVFEALTTADTMRTVPMMLTSGGVGTAALTTPGNSFCSA